MSRQMLFTVSAPNVPTITHGPNAMCVVVMGGFPKCNCKRLIPCVQHSAGATGGINTDRYLPQLDRLVSPFPMKKASLEDELRLQLNPEHFAAFTARALENANKCDACREDMLIELCVRSGAKSGAEYGEGHPLYAPNTSRMEVTENDPNDPYDSCTFVSSTCPQCNRTERDLFLCFEHPTEAEFMAACTLDWKILEPGRRNPLTVQTMNHAMEWHIFVNKKSEHCDQCRPGRG